ncbi:MAG: metal ABC transporter permease [Fibrobacter sp.]|nr:metal ABC transporter permease [Fibrobacter sp.]
MGELFQFDFMRNAFIAGILVSVVSGVVGTLVVVNRLSFLAGGIAHTAYGGLGLAAFLGWPPMLGTIPFTLTASMVMGHITRKKHERSDTVVGIMWAMGMAMGIIFLDLKSGYYVDLMSYLFGSIMAISNQSLIFMAALNLVIILTVTLLFKEITGMSYDEEFAEISGVPVRALYYIIITLITLSVIMLMQAVGLILVIALFTIPVSIAEMFTRQIKHVMFLSSVLGAIFCTLGLVLSYYLDLTAGAAIIILAGSGYGAGYLIKKAFFKKVDKVATGLPAAK